MKPLKMSGLALLAMFLLTGLIIPQPVFAQESGETPTSTPEPTVPLATVEPGFEASTASSAKSGLPGSTVSYTINVTNNSTTDSVDITITSDDSAAASPNSLSLPAGASGSFLIQVGIPATAVSGQTITSQVNLTGGGSTRQIQFITSVLAATATPSFSRPLIVLESYNAGKDTIAFGEEFNLRVRLYNKGGSKASNLVMTVSGTDFMPLETGGVSAVSSLSSGNTVDIDQPMRASNSLWGVLAGTVGVTLTYTDSYGTAYSEQFAVTINIQQPGAGAVQATATPTSMPRAQMVVESYSTDIDPLQPGSTFKLNLQIRNLGSMDARDVSMILGGGGTTSSTSTTSGDDISGLVGGSGDLTTFAPLGSSNIVYLNTIPQGSILQTSSQLIVNVSANPGAYSFKISFVYNDANGKRVVDDQVITLLVYSLPQVDIGFYRDPGILMAGQPNQLPLQITNLGRKTSVLGNMKVTADGLSIEQNTALVGSLEPGGYFTLDSMITPMESGTVNLHILINYTDDFNQPRTIEQILPLEIQAMPTMEPFPEGPLGPDGLPITDSGYIQGEETFGQKIGRFLKGMIGLDSGKPQPAMPMPLETMPGESMPDKSSVPLG